MKTYSLTVVLCCFLCLTSYAQKESLSTNAAELFKSVNTLITTPEKNLIAELSGFKLNKLDNEYYRSTFEEEANTPFKLVVYALDLTNDGQEEIAILYGPKTGTGKTGLASLLFVKDLAGQFKLNIDVPGELYFINMSNLVFPDVLVKNSSIEYPTFRWDGNQYNPHTTMYRSKINKLNITTLPRASSRYTATLIRE